MYIKKIKIVPYRVKKTSFTSPITVILSEL